MNHRDIIVVGASAGGLQALQSLLGQLPADLPAAIFIVRHIAPDYPSLLPEILRRSSALPVAHPSDGEPFAPGRIYLAPPNRHLVLENDRIKLTQGPRENRFRPSVDVLFRSAAAYGPRVVGAVLTGLLDDGASGLYAIKQQGGVAVVQDPLEAEYPDMPLNAMRRVAVDYSLPLAKIGSRLVALVTEPLGAGAARQVPEEMDIEIKIALDENAFEKGVIGLGAKTSLTCPECRGALNEIDEGGLVRYRCHTGHGYSLGALLAEVEKNIESTLWQALSRIEESEMLLARALEALRESEHGGRGTLEAELAAAREKARTVRRALLVARKD